MKTRNRISLALGAIIAFAALLAAPAAHAAGTPANTVISNTATVDFEDVNGNPLTQNSNTVTTTVSQVAAVDIAPPADSSNAIPGDLVCYMHTVTNNGNDTDTVEIATASSQGWTVTVYEDTNGNGSYDAGVDTALADTNASAGIDTGALPDSVSSPGNESMDILVCVDVPAGTASGTVDATDIDVTSDNDGGQIDSATDTTTIDAPALSVVKSVLPAGNQPPGTVLTYTVVITNNGSGDAQNVVFTDPIPTNTTYQGGTITQDGAPRTDGVDADNTDHDVTNPGEITVSIGTLSSGGGTTTIEFQVAID